MNRSTRGLWGYILLVLLFLFLIFGLRDSLNQDAFLECVAGLEKLYEE